MQTVVGIFAHPDDEAFGPSGTLAKLARENDIYLICATNGDAATGKHDPQLGEIRKEELRKSANILGIKEVFFLECKDGTLCNNIYFELADAISPILKKLTPWLVITLEPRGVSGHIDHMVVTMVTNFVCQKLSFVKEIWYNCLEAEVRSKVKNYYIYFPPGYTRSQIDKIIDVSTVWEQKCAAINQHVSQINDVENITKLINKSKKEEYFLVWKRKR